MQALELEEQLIKRRSSDVVDQSLIDLERQTLLMRRDGEKYRKRVAERHEKMVDRQLSLLEMQLKLSPNGAALASR